MQVKSSKDYLAEASEARGEDWTALRAAMAAIKVNDIVIFSPRAGETAEGIVTRVWDKPAKDPYVTVVIEAEDGSGRKSTFVRCGSEVTRTGA